MEAKKQQSTCIYSSCFKNSPELIVCINLSTKKIVDCNMRFTRKLGWKKSSIIGKPFLSICHPSCKPIVNSILHNGSKQKDLKDKTINIKTRLGKTLDVATHLHFFHCESKPMVLIFLREITPYLESHPRLSAYKNLFTNMRSGVAIYKPTEKLDDFIIVDFNRGAEHIEKISRQKVVGKKLTKTFPGVKTFGLFAVLKRVYITGKPEHFPVKMYKDKRITGWRDNYVYKLPSGEVVAVYNDRTKEKILQAELAEHQQHLEELVDQRTNELQQEIIIRSEAEQKLKDSTRLLLETERVRALGVFAAGVAHELNNPLMGVLSILQYMQSHPCGDKQPLFLRDAEHETLRCINTLKNLLSFAYAKTPEEEPFVVSDIKLIIERILRLLDYRISKEHIKLELSIPKTIPKIKIQPHKIQHAILNIITNAVDALKRSKQKNISIKIHRRTKYLYITITDTGCGIESDKYPLLFEPFYTTKPEGEGTGLGLPMAKNIIEADHKGKIKFHSRPKRGTSFQLILPI